MKKYIRFIIYFFIIIVYIFYIQNFTCGIGFSCNKLYGNLWLCLIPVIEFIYTLIHSLKYKMVRIVIIILIIITIISISIYQNKNANNEYKCPCSMAICDKDYKSCKVYDENNNLVCTRDCSKYIVKD